jgi:hypothetical protein
MIGNFYDEILVDALNKEVPLHNMLPKIVTVPHWGKKTFENVEWPECNCGIEVYDDQCYCEPIPDPDSVTIDWFYMPTINWRILSTPKSNIKIGDFL